MFGLVLGALGGVVAGVAKAGLGMMGFTATGVAAASAASAIQSSIAHANGYGIIRGSLFAVIQWFTMR
jgi:hypothetical protein